MVAVDVIIQKRTGLLLEEEATEDSKFGLSFAGSLLETAELLFAGKFHTTLGVLADKGEISNLAGSADEAFLVCVGCVEGGQVKGLEEGLGGVDVEDLKLT